MLWALKTKQKISFIYHSCKHVNHEIGRYLYGSVKYSVCLINFLLMFSSSVMRRWRNKSAYSSKTSLQGRSSICSICSFQGVLISEHPTFLSSYFQPFTHQSDPSSTLFSSFTLSAVPGDNPRPAHTLRSWQYGQLWHKLGHRWCSQQRSDTGLNPTVSVHRWETSG